MTRITNLVLKLKVWKDTRGQDLIEYALMAGFVAVAAGAIMPSVATSISTIFSKVGSVGSDVLNTLPNWFRAQGYTTTAQDAGGIEIMLFQ